MTARVLVRAELLDAACAELDGERAHHLRRVARVRDGERVVAFDGAGRERAAVIEGARRGSVTLRYVEPARRGATRDAARITWLQGVPKGDKLEGIARQATELGVERFVPVYTARAIPVERADRAASRHARLARVIEEAARQCGRADLPELSPAVGMREALALAAPCALKLVAWERASEPLASMPDPGGGGVAVLAGPEGGLDESEVLLAREAGFLSVSLGPRILRAETVAPALVALLSSRWGDLRAP